MLSDRKLKSEFRGAKDCEEPRGMFPECGAAGAVLLSSPAVLRNQAGHDVHVTETGVELVEFLACNGNSLTTIAKRLGIASSTLRDVRRRQPEVAEAIERGYSLMEDELVDILMTRARDPGHKGGVTAAIFLLKARRGYEGVKRPEHLTIINDNRQQVLQLPSAEDRDAYLQRVRETFSED